MKVKHQVTLLIVLIFNVFTLNSQELNCVVNVNARQIEGSEKVIFDEMQKAIFQLINGRKWTSDEFESHERIECSIIINLTDRVSTNRFKGNIQVQASRPIFNSTYKSRILNVRDEDLTFDYNQFSPIQYNEGTYNGELVAIISYYVYMILGFDYDSFALEGGTPYFQEAQRIVTNAQRSGEIGWKAFESSSQKNRYWLVENTLNARFKPLRTAYFEMHMKGFDKMTNGVERGRRIITKNLKSLREIHNVSPSSYNLQAFFNAKMQEILNLYSEASEQERNEIRELLITIDPGNSNKYGKLK